MQPQPPVEHGDQDTAFDATSPMVTHVQVVVPMPATIPLNVPVPSPTPPADPLPLNNWSAVTNLVTRDDGRLQQSAQSREISKYISKTVRLANLKVFFVDAFPDLETQNIWLSESLVSVLKDQAQTDDVAREVDLRAKNDPWYMPALIRMVRW